MPNFSNFEEPADTYDFNNVSNDMWGGFGGESNVFGDMTGSVNNIGSFGVSAFDLNNTRAKDNSSGGLESKYNPANYINKLDFESIMNQTFQDISGTNLQF